jgi:ferredoxin
MSLRVRVEGTDRVLVGPQGEDLLEVFQSGAQPIATSCGGVASCGLCRVTIDEGRHLLVPLKAQEIVHLGSVAKVLGLRLACQAQIRPDAMDGAEIVVRIPPVEDVEQRKRKKAERALHGAPTQRSPSSVRRPPIEWRPGRRSEPEKGPEGKGGT